MTIVCLLLYGRAVSNLGASGGAAFGALVPALSALLAIPLLDEWPNETDWVGIVLISAGVYLASGGPLPHWKQRQRRNEEDGLGRPRARGRSQYCGCERKMSASPVIVREVAG